VLVSQRGLGADGGRLIASLEAADIEVVVSTFNGECSLAEIDSHVTKLAEESVDCLIAVGGGKCVDAGKAVAYRLAVPIVIVPTLASNDAPCSALSVIYTPAGVTAGVESYPASPALVIVDTGVVAEAAERYLAAGMGDAMATWYEARVCLENEKARTPLGARPTLASCALGEICAQTLYAHGRAAAKAVVENMVDEPLEKVVEANTLLSGIGFESGGIAAAHGIAQSYTAIPQVHDNYLHGEMVAMGLVAQLVMESKIDEASKVATFFASVGLPVHLGQISLGPGDNAHLDTVAEVAVAFPLMHNMPFPVTADVVKTAVLDAHELGLSVAAAQGDVAYRRLQAG
jgi:glycerol dehydrogenase